MKNIDDINIDERYIKKEDFYKIKALTDLVKGHSPETYVHLFDVARRSVVLGKMVGLSHEDLVTVYSAGLLHDVGKVVVDTKLLHKFGLTKEDVEIIREQHIKGTKLIIDGYFDKDIVETCFHHHERLDGSGYPLGIKGDQITLNDRIVQVADVVSAMVLHRSYREGVHTYDEAKEVINMLAAKGRLDADVVHQMNDALLVEQYYKDNVLTGKVPRKDGDFSRDIETLLHYESISEFSKVKHVELDKKPDEKFEESIFDESTPYISSTPKQAPSRKTEDPAQ